jgi:hypothetical protein
MEDKQTKLITTLTLEHVTLQQKPLKKTIEKNTHTEFSQLKTYSTPHEIIFPLVHNSKQK